MLFIRMFRIITSIENPKRYLKLTATGMVCDNQPIHTSQKVIEKRIIIVELEIIPTYELTMLIMGWGAKWK